MIESSVGREVLSSPERSFYSETVGLQARLAMTENPDYLDPTKVVGDLPTEFASNESIKKAAEATTKASLKDRKAFYQTKPELANFDGKLDWWASEWSKILNKPKNEAILTKLKTFNLRSGDQTINFESFTKEEASKLYLNYLDQTRDTPERVGIQSLVEDIVQSHTSRENLPDGTEREVVDIQKLKENHDAILFLAQSVSDKKEGREAFIALVYARARRNDPLLREQANSKIESSSRLNKLDSDSEVKVLDWINQAVEDADVSDADTSAEVDSEDTTPVERTPIPIESRRVKKLEVERIALDEAREILKETESKGVDKDHFKHLATIPEDYLNDYEQFQIPKYKLKLNGAEVFLPDKAVNPSSSSRDFVVGIVRKDEKNIARVFYRSNSQASWRLLPAYDSSNGWYVKGYDEESLNLPPELQFFLDRLSEGESEKSVSENNLFDLVTDAPDAYNKGPSYFGALESEITGNVDKDGAKLDGHFYPTGRIIKNPPETLTFNNKNQEPDFSNPVANWTSKNGLYGEMQNEVFFSKDGTIQYLFCRNHEGKAWIKSAFLVSSEINRSGLKTKWLDLGDLGTPAYEYDTQTAGYGDRAKRRGSYLSMFENYHSKIPVIQEYLARDLDTLKKAA